MQPTHAIGVLLDNKRLHPKFILLRTSRRLHKKTFQLVKGTTPTLFSLIFPDHASLGRQGPHECRGWQDLRRSKESQFTAAMQLFSHVGIISSSLLGWEGVGKGNWGLAVEELGKIAFFLSFEIVKKIRLSLNRFLKQLPICTTAIFLFPPECCETFQIKHLEV